MFKIAPACVTFATNVTERVTPKGMFAIVPVSVPAVLIKSVPPGVPVDTNCKPVGNTSFTSTFVAVFGPSFVIEIV